MTKTIYFLSAIFIALIAFQSCTRVAPNFAGVLQENYGKNGKSDFTEVYGKVSTWGMGTELFQVPIYEQRAAFDADVHFQDADRTEYSCKPSYSYQAIKGRYVDLVFQNKHLESGEEFMKELEMNILEPQIYDIGKDICRAIRTDSLTASGANLRFERTVYELVRKAFEEKGLELKTFTLQLVPSDKVREQIDARSQVNTNVSVIDQEIIQQRKRNELARLQAEENRIIDSGLTNKFLTYKFIQKWDGRSSLYGVDLSFVKQVQ